MIKDILIINYLRYKSVFVFVEKTKYHTGAAKIVVQKAHECFLRFITQSVG